MTYIAKKGKAAAVSATQEKQDYSKALVSLKSGTTLKVRLASDEDFVEYYAASVYKTFYTTPVAPGNLYQKVADLLYADANNEKDEKKAEEIRNQAYLIKPKPRYLFGFIDLESGESIIVDFTKAQAQAVIQSIDKYAKRIGKIAFELSKQGSGTSTSVTLSPIIDMEEDLTDKERANFEKAEGKTIPDDLYENVLYVKNEQEQLEDITKFGFDVSRLGVTANDEVTPIVGETDAAEYEF